MFWINLIWGIKTIRAATCKYKWYIVSIILMYSTYWLGELWTKFPPEEIDPFWSHIMKITKDWYVLFSCKQGVMLIVSIVLLIFAKRDIINQWLAVSFLSYWILDTVWFLYNFKIEKGSNYYTIYWIWLFWDTWVFLMIVWKKKVLKNSLKEVK